MVLGTFRTVSILIQKNAIRQAYLTMKGGYIILRFLGSILFDICSVKIYFVFLSKARSLPRQGETVSGYRGPKKFRPIVVVFILFRTELRYIQYRFVSVWSKFNLSDFFANISLFRFVERNCSPKFGFDL